MSVAAVKPTLRCVGFQQITSLNSAVGLTIPDAGANLALIQAETQNVRWRADGTNPTTAIGGIIYATGEALAFDGDLSTIKLIEVTTSAKVNVHYFHDPSRVPA